MTTIISKIELLEGQFLKYTDIGYTEDNELINSINENYDNSLGLFLGENRTKIEIGIVTLNEFFDTVEYVNEARTQTEEIDEKLIKINKLTDL